MGLGLFLSIVAARWKLSVVVLLAVVTAAAVLVNVSPTRYTAHASMLVDTGRSTSDPAGRLLFGMEQRTYIATQIQILGGERVASAVAASLSHEQKELFRKEWIDAGSQGQFDEWIIERLLKMVTITPSREANVIEVTARGSSPELVADIANLFVARYMDVALDLRVKSAQQYLGFFERQAEELRLKVEQARLKLAGFQQSRGILTTGDQQDVEAARLADLSREVTLLEAQLAEVSGREAQARQRGDQTREVTSDPVIVAMRTDLQRARTSLSELQQNLGPNHPKIIELRRSIADQEGRLARETARVTAAAGIEKSVTSQRLAAARAALKAQSTKVASMSVARAEASVLIADVESAQSAYDSVVKSLNQMRLESQATQGNATLLEAAAPPIKPSGVPAAILLALSVFVGTILGIAAGLVRELFDRRIRSEDQLAQLVEQPVLVTVPSFSGLKKSPPRISSKRALSGTQRRLPAA